MEHMENAQLITISIKNEVNIKSYPPVSDIQAVKRTMNKMIDLHTEVSKKFFTKPFKKISLCCTTYVTNITIVLVFNKVTLQSTHWSIQTLSISGGDSSCSWVFY